MDEKEFSDEDLENELDKALNENRKKRSVFRILADEKTALNMKEKRIIPQLKPKKQNDEEEFK
jgi:hypothetical protein